MIKTKDRDTCLFDIVKLLEGQIMSNDFEKPCTKVPIQLSSFLIENQNIININRKIQGRRFAI